MRRTFAFLILASIVLRAYPQKVQDSMPNVLFIYVDDLGYGDLSTYGATKIKTPNIDAIAASGIRFTNGHASAATCTPSRYSLMTGRYPFRKSGTGVLPGDARLIIDEDQITLPDVFKKAGYQTAMIGKWHLGLGDAVEKDWNRDIKPGPLELGYDYSFIFPATADRVPTVFLEGHNVVASTPNDPIEVSYKQKVGTDPTGLENPELLKMKSSPGHGHSNTIVNGIGRIGWMSGGTQARWTDEELTYTFLDRARWFIENNKEKPFFLSYHATEPHVPRMPATQFKGKSGLGYRGDAILQLDHTVGELVKSLKENGVYQNTIIIFTSDNGPVLDDGYVDGAVTELGGHDQNGGLRGGKYSAFEAGTRVPFIISWPGKIKAGTESNALLCQIDFLASFAAFLGVKEVDGRDLDSKDLWSTFMGIEKKGRSQLVKTSGTFSITQGNMKYIKPRKGTPLMKLVNIETGFSLEDQLYNLEKDPGERENIAGENSKKVAELKQLLHTELEPIKK